MWLKETKNKGSRKLFSKIKKRIGVKERNKD